MTRAPSIRSIAAISAWTCAISFVGLDARGADPTKTQCIAANEEAETLRQHGKLQAARTQLLVCVAPSCPQAVREDCAERLNELERAIPTIVFTAKGPDGSDLVAVKVMMDGAPVADRLDGSAISVEPGQHTFEFTVEGYPTLSKKLVVREGVKGRQEVIAFGVSGTAEKQARLLVRSGAAASILIDGSVVGTGRFEGRVAPGTHEVRVTEPGKSPYKASIDLRDDEVRTVEVTLEPERSSILPWVIGGAVIVAAGAAIGGYFLFAPEDRTAPPPTGKLGSVTLLTFGR